MPQSPFLRNEIASCNIGQNKAAIYFKNRSQIITRTSSENARSARANIVVIDEFRMVDKHVVDSVIREFLKAPRRPGYLNKPEYKHLKERNQEIYMSSAYYKSSQAQTKACSYTRDFLRDNKKYFICGLPYQVSIQSDLLMASQIEDQMNELDFDPISFSMEDECLFYGDTDGSLFKYDEINKRRKIRTALLPLKQYESGKADFVKPPVDGRRVLSIDVALMASSKKAQNDASSIYINDVVKADMYSYHSNFVYGKNFEGLTTDELGIIIMRWFYHYKCTDIVLDTAGVGLGCYDFIIKDQYDSETGETYRALTACNNDEMAQRCKVQDALKVVWCVKASAAFNNEIAVLLRNGIQNGKINFLISELDADEPLKKVIKGYDKLTLGETVELKAAYAQTTLAEYELVKLGYEVVGGNIKVKEKTGMRKDRYSSIAYSYQCACQLEKQLRPQYANVESMLDKFRVRKASYLR